MKRVFVAIGSRYAGIVSQFVVVALVARELPKHDAGQYLLLSGIVQATCFVAGLGLPDGLVPSAAQTYIRDGRHASYRVIQRGMAVAAGATFVVAGLVSLVTFGISGNGDVSLLMGLWWLNYGLLFVFSQALVAAAKSSLGAFLYYSAQNLCVLPAIAVFLLSGWATTATEAVLVVVVAGSIATGYSGFVAIRTCSRSGSSVNPIAPTLRRAWGWGWQIAAGRVLQAAILWLPVWVAASTISTSAGADMGVASRLAAAAAAAIAAVRFSIRPVIARDSAKGDWPAIIARSRRIAFLASGIAILALMVVAVLGSSVIPLVFGSEYDGATLLLLVLLVGTLGESLGGPVDEVLKMSGHAAFVLLAQAACLVSTFVCMLLVGIGGTPAIASVFAVGFAMLHIVYILRVKALSGGWILPVLARSRS